MKFDLLSRRVMKRPQAASTRRDRYSGVRMLQERTNERWLPVKVFCEWLPGMAVGFVAHMEDETFYLFLLFWAVGFRRKISS